MLLMSIKGLQKSEGNGIVIVKEQKRSSTKILQEFASQLQLPLFNCRTFPRGLFLTDRKASKGKREVNNASFLSKPEVHFALQF